MKKTFIIFIVLLSFIFTEINAQQSYVVKRGERPPIDLEALPYDAFEKGFIKIKLDESFTNQLDSNPVFVNENGIVSFNITEIDELNQRFGAKSFKKTFESRAFSSEFSDRHRAWGFHLWYTLYYDEETDIKELVFAYDKLADVSIAEPQYKTELHEFPPNIPENKTDGENSGTPAMDWTPNDPSYGVQWHYHNTGQQSGTVDADIDLPEAWNLETGNSNVIVSVHDMGIQHTHPDIIGNMWSGIGWDFYNDDATIEAGYHGTHVGGTVAAESNNGIGVSGVAGGTGSNDGIRLMTCMVYHPTLGGGVGHHLAPVYAADNGASIEQNSWGYTNPGAYDQAVLDAIDYFNLNGGGTALSGGITIYAAGNSNSSGAYYPGYYSGTLAVAATNNQDIRSYYSNYGSWVDIAAPGGETHIVTARGVYSTYTGSSYNYLQGTSMACPHVSGVAALIVSNAYGQLSAADVKAILISPNSVDDIDALNPTYAGLLGSGRTNAYKALLETQNYLVTPGDMMPLPPHTTAFTGNVRGYWYQAPTDFTISGLRVPTDVTGDQTIEIIRFNSGAPPFHPGLTNDFVSLGRWVGVAGSGIISCNIPVADGDYIGILGCRGTTTSYGTGPYVTSIDGNAVTLTRLGMQFPLPTNLAHDIWQEASGSIGRIEMYYEKFSTWTGLINTSWTNAGNWSGLYVPNQHNDVVIPSGCPNYPVLGGSLGINTAAYTYDCKSLNINPGATISLPGGYDVNNYGELIVGGSLSIGDDIFLYSGSTVDLSGTISLGTFTGWYGEAYHYSGSVFNQTAGNYNVETLALNDGSQFNGTGGATHIYVNGDTPAENTVQINDPDSYFYFFLVDAGANALLYNCTYDLEAYYTGSNGPLNINSYTMNADYMDAYSELIINSGGTLNVPINGPYIHTGATLTMGSGSELNCKNIPFFAGSVVNVSGGEIFVDGNFTDYDEVFMPTAGSVTFDGGNAANITGPTSFYNLVIDKTGGVKSSSQVNYKEGNPIDYTKTNIDSPSNSALVVENSLNDGAKANDVSLASNITVANDFTINNGIFNSNTFNINVAGDWVNNVGDAAFVESTGRVIFDGGNFHQYCSNETFNILEINKPIGGAFRMDGTNVVCAAYDWTAGAVDVLTGSFTANDLLDDGIAGAFYNNTGGAINLINNDATNYVDLNGDLHIFGGTVTITGAISDWPFSNNASIEMSGGILDFPTCGIGIYNDGANTFTHNITGGTIRTAQGFYGARTDFTPTAGLFEFYGSGDAVITQLNGCTLWDVHIDNGAKNTSVIEQLIPTSGDRVDITAGTGGKANSTLLGSEFTIANNLTISSGTLNLNSYIANVLGGATVNGGTLMVNENASLMMGDGTSLNVNSGGLLHAIGSIGNEATIQAFGSGYYNFSVNSGGTMGAEYAIFEDMTINGVFLTPESFVDPVYSFNYCTFQNGTIGFATLFNVATNQSFTSVGANFPDASSSEFNTYKWNGSTGEATFLNATGVFAGSAYEFDPSDQIHWTVAPYEVDLKVYLEGPYNTGSNLMNLDLSIGGYIPLSQPYFPALPYYGNASPTWLYLGGESVGSIPANVVDWVVVQLRDANSPTNATSARVLETRAGFLLNDGSVVDLDGTSNMIFDKAIFDNLYVVVYHRNHLGIMSNYGLIESGGIYNYDFSSGINQVFGGASGHKELEPGVWSMIAADGDADGSVLPSDKTSVWLPDANSTGYRGGDYNMNGIGQPDDMTNFWLPNANKAGQIPAKGAISGYQSQIPE